MKTEETMTAKVERLRKVVLHDIEDMVGKTVKAVNYTIDGDLISFIDGSIIKIYAKAYNDYEDSVSVASLWPADFVELNLMTKEEWNKWSEERKILQDKQQKEDIEKADLANYKRLKNKFESKNHEKNL